HDLDDLGVAEAEFLGFAEQILRDRVDTIFREVFFHVTDLLDLIEEPAIDAIRGFGDGTHRYAGHQRILDAEDAVPFRRLDIFDQFFGMHQALSIVAEADSIVLETLTGFLNGFRKASADGHHFADALHLQTQGIVGAFELIEVPTWYLDDDIILHG